MAHYKIVSDKDEYIIQRKENSNEEWITWSRCFKTKELAERYISDSKDADNSIDRQNKIAKKNRREWIIEELLENFKLIFYAVIFITIFALSIKLCVWFWTVGAWL